VYPVLATFQPVKPFVLSPGGMLKVCELGLSPLAITSIVAPPVTGLPTMVSLLRSSLPSTTRLRLVASTPGSGSFTTSVLPRIS